MVVLLLWIAAALGWAGSALADTLTLANGDTLQGEVVLRGEEGVVLEHPQLGRLQLRPDQLQPGDEERPLTGLLGTGLLPGWNRRVDLGINGKQGNTETTNLTAGLRFDYEDDWVRWDVDGRYFFSNSEEGDSDNNARLDMRRDWLFPGSRWFAALSGRYQFDQFEAWKHRITVYGGPGYNLIRSGGHRLDVVLAPAFTHEFGGDDDDQAEGVLNFDYSWQIAEDHVLSLGNSVFTELAPNQGAVRNFSTANWSILLTRDPLLSLNLGVESEYETQPEDGDRKHDLKYFLTLGLDL